MVFGWRRGHCFECRGGGPCPRVGTHWLRRQPQRWHVPWESLMSVLRARGSLPAAGSGSPTTTEGSWSAQYPGLWEMLSAPTMPDGSPRQGATLMLFCGDGGVQACLNDRDQDWVCFRTASSVDALLEGLEKGLQADSLEWRRPRGVKGSRSRK